MAIGDRHIIGQSLGAGASYQLIPPVGTYYLIESINVGGQITFYQRPSVVVNGTGGSFRVHDTEGRTIYHHLNIPVMNDCYFTLTNPTAGAFSIDISYIEVPGPFFYYAEKVVAGSPTNSATVLLSAGQEGYISSVANNGGGISVTYGSSTVIDMWDRTSTSTSDNLFCSLSLEIDDVKGLRVDNYSSGTDMTMIIMGIITKGA